MPFQGRSLPDAVSRFAEHINGLLARTITQSRLVVNGTARGGRFTPTVLYLAFRRGGQTRSAPLRTRFGPMGLFLGWAFDSVTTESGIHQLRTMAYAYHLTPAAATQPILRWEYVREPPDSDARWCRHHLQGPVPLRFDQGAEASLNDLHLPTGWVPIEEIVRFCIVDLGVRPLSPGRHQTLIESLQVSGEQFNT